MFEPESSPARSVLNEAVDGYLKFCRRQLEEARKGLTEADAPAFAPDEEVTAAL
jgi:predicted transcriptional regulator